MGGYLVNFTIYTMAMLGLISFAVFVFKKFTDGTMRSNKSKFLDVEDSMSLSPRKTLHVVTENLERFRNIELEQPTQFQNFQEEIQLLPQQVHLEPIRGRNPEAPIRRGMDRRATSNIEVQKSHGFSTMKEMAMKINEL